jgi:hypothetical protein
MYVTISRINKDIEISGDTLELTVVSTNESITPVADEPAIGNLLASLKGNVHVAID